MPAFADKIYDDANFISTTDALPHAPVVGRLFDEALRTAYFCGFNSNRLLGQYHCAANINAFDLPYVYSGSYYTPETGAAYVVETPPDATCLIALVRVAMLPGDPTYPVTLRIAVTDGTNTDTGAAYSVTPQNAEPQGLSTAFIDPYALGAGAVVECEVRVDFSACTAGDTQEVVFEHANSGADTGVFLLALSLYWGVD